MAIPCGSCGFYIPIHEDGRVPPWCPACGADLKPKGSLSLPALVGASEESPNYSPEPVEDVSSSREHWNDPESGPLQSTNRQPLQTLSGQLALVGGVVAGMVVPILLRSYLPPQVGPGFDFNRIFISGIGGGIGVLLGAGIGAGIGRLFEEPNE